MEVLPMKGSIYGGTKLTLKGQEFTSEISKIEIKIGTFTCFVEEVSDTKIVCIVGNTGGVVKIDNQGIHQSKAFTDMFLLFYRLFCIVNECFYH